MKVVLKMNPPPHFNIFVFLLPPQSIWGTLVGNKRHIDVEMFNYDGILFF